MQTVSPKLTDRVVKELLDFAGNKNAGAMEAIEGYTYIRRATLAELKGRFTRPEVLALIDMYNGTLLSAELQYQQEVLQAKIEDAERYEGSCSNNNADTEALLAKAGELTAAQVWVLQQEIVRAWSRNINDGVALKKLLEYLSAS